MRCRCGDRAYRLWLLTGIPPGVWHTLVLFGAAVIAGEVLRLVLR